MKVNDLFDLRQGNSLELMHIGTSKNTDINFVSRTSQNNGVVAQVNQVEGITPFAPGLISVALSGNGVCSAFVQPRLFYTAFHVAVLSPKKDMTIAEKLYYCMCIKANAYKYCWGRQANKTLKDIEIPDFTPDWVYNIPIAPLKTKIKQKTVELHPVEKWGEFRIGDIFTSFECCKCNVARDLLSDGNDCYYLGAKKDNNGIMRRVTYDADLITSGNCIVFICDGQGSVGYTNYMNEDFIGSTTLSVGRNEFINKYTGMFLVSVLDLERPKYSFGRKYRTKIANTIIKLPVKNNVPDWAYMEDYIKSLPYSDRI